jgi:hypothetical protein
MRALVFGAFRHSARPAAHGGKTPFLDCYIILPDIIMPDNLT